MIHKCKYIQKYNQFYMIQNNSVRFIHAQVVHIIIFTSLFHVITSSNSDSRQYIWSSGSFCEVASLSVGKMSHKVLHGHILIHKPWITILRCLVSTLQHKTQSQYNLGACGCAPKVQKLMTSEIELNPENVSGYFKSHTNNGAVTVH